MNRLAVRGRPGGVHDFSATDTGGERKAAGQSLAEADDVGSHPRVLAGEPFPGAAEAGEDFVENQERAVFVAELAQQGKKPWRGDAESSAPLTPVNVNSAQ